MKRILLITHEATRTGAPMVVLHYARWLRVHRPGVRIDILSLTKGGGLKEAFKEVADHYFEWAVPPMPPKGMARRVVDRSLYELGLRHVPSSAEVKDGILREIAARGHDVIHANSLASIPVGRRVKALQANGPVLVAHVHELEMVLRQVLPELRDLLPSIDVTLAASQLVRENLVTRWGFDQEKVKVQYECADIRRADGGGSSRGQGAVFHVGASGTVNLRKGYDLFIQVARWIRSNHPGLPMKFTWVGRMGANEKLLVEHDIEHAGLVDMVEFVGELSDPGSTYDDFDLFVLPSREDPFPLVCIEAGLLGKPIICFQGATGTAEVLREGGGRIVPYLDVEAMGRSIVEYAKDPALVGRDGSRNRAQFAQFTPVIQCPLMQAHIDRALELDQGRA